MKPIVWTEVELHPEAHARLAAEAEVIKGTYENLPGADAAVIGRSTVDAAFIERAGPNFKFAVRHGIGYNTMDVPVASSLQVLCANTPDAPTESTAEHAVALLLAIAKRVVKSDMYMRANRTFGRYDLLGTEVLDRVLGVVGYGRIGRRVVEVCAAGLKMKVLVLDPFLTSDAILPENVSRVETLDEMLPQIDFLTLHTPLMKETYHLISDRELGMMKQGSYVINVSRGPVIDEPALIRALQSGHLAGAALDVFDPEPPEPGNPLLQMENVVITPHIASSTDRGYLKMSSSCVDQILQLFRGEKPSFLIDPSVWPGRVKIEQE